MHVCVEKKEIGTGLARARGKRRERRAMVAGLSCEDETGLVHLGLEHSLDVGPGQKTCELGRALRPAEMRSWALIRAQP